MPVKSQIWQWIKDVIAKLTKRGNNRTYYEYIRNAEKLYANAIKASIGGVSLTQVRETQDFIAEFERLVAEEEARALDNGEDVRYSKKTNDLWSALNKNEKAIFYKTVDEIHHQNYYETKLDNGDYLIDVNNKIIISDGAFNQPSIEGIVEFSQHFPNKISDARDYFYEKITNGRTIQESIEFINELYEEKVAIFYGKENSKYDWQSGKQGQDYQSNRADSEQQQRKTSAGTPRYSLSQSTETDSNGTPLSPAQSRFFKDSKVRDTNGSLKVVYHGTPNGKFTIFDAHKLSASPRLSQLGQGFYFTDDRQSALDYTKDENRTKNQPHLFETYLNIEKPFYLSLKRKQLDRDKLLNVILQGDNDWFYNEWIPFELEDVTIFGKVYSRDDIEKLSRKDRADLWLQYHYDDSGIYEADRHILSELVRAYKFDSQGKLLENITKELNIDGIIFEDGYNANQWRYVTEFFLTKKTARGCAVLSGNNCYAFVLFEELPEHDLVDFAATALVLLFDFAEALVDLLDLFRVFLPTEPQEPHFLLLEDVLFAALLVVFVAFEALLVLFLFLPNIVFTSRLCCKKDILPHLLCATFDKKYQIYFFIFLKKVMQSGHSSTSFTVMPLAWQWHS